MYLIYIFKAYRIFIFFLIFYGSEEQSFLAINIKEETPCTDERSLGISSPRHHGYYSITRVEKNLCLKATFCVLSRIIHTFKLDIKSTTNI